MTQAIPRKTVLIPRADVKLQDATGSNRFARCLMEKGFEVKQERIGRIRKYDSEGISAALSESVTLTEFTYKLDILTANRNPKGSATWAIRAVESRYDNNDGFAEISAELRLAGLKTAPLLHRAFDEAIRKDDRDKLVADIAVPIATTDKTSTGEDRVGHLRVLLSGRDEVPVVEDPMAHLHAVLTAANRLAQEIREVVLNPPEAIQNALNAMVSQDRIDGLRALISGDKGAKALLDAYIEHTKTDRRAVGHRHLYGSLSERLRVADESLLNKDSETAQHDIALGTVGLQTRAGLVAAINGVVGADLYYVVGEEDALSRIEFTGEEPTIKPPINNEVLGLVSSP